jgi:hypothetical protein
MGQPGWACEHDRQPCTLYSLWRELGIGGRGQGRGDVWDRSIRGCSVRTRGGPIALRTSTRVVDASSSSHGRGARWVRLGAGRGGSSRDSHPRDGGWSRRGDACAAADGCPRGELVQLVRLRSHLVLRLPPQTNTATLLSIPLNIPCRPLAVEGFVWARAVVIKQTATLRSPK